MPVPKPWLWVYLTSTAGAAGLGKALDFLLSVVLKQAENSVPRPVFLQ